MAFENKLPTAQFPGFTWSSVVAPQVQEIITTFNAESLDALSSVPEKFTAWADIGSKVTQGIGIVKVPIRLPSSLGFLPFDGTRSYNSIDIAAPVVKVNPFHMDFGWPMVINEMGAQLLEFYGVTGVAQSVVAAARAFKAQAVASLTYLGFTNSGLGQTAQVLTIPQPGNASGLPLFSDGGATFQYGTAGGSAAHYAHPFRDTSARFTNLYVGVGTFQNYFPQSLVDMTQVPHPALPNLPLGCEVTDVVGPTWMQIPFYQAAVQTLSLQTQTSPFNAAAATTNPYNAELLAKASSATFVGASGLAPWRFWIAPQLDNHPYYTANSSANMTSGPGGGPAHMWLSISHRQGNVQSWAELAGPTKEFTPKIHLFGDGDPQSISERRIRMLSDLDCGIGAGLPHFVKMYFGVA